MLRVNIIDKNYTYKKSRPLAEEAGRPEGAARDAGAEEEPERDGSSLLSLPSDHV